MQFSPCTRSGCMTRNAITASLTYGYTFSISNEDSIRFPPLLHPAPTPQLNPQLTLDVARPSRVDSRRPWCRPGMAGDLDGRYLDGGPERAACLSPGSSLISWVSAGLVWGWCGGFQGALLCGFGCKVAVQWVEVLCERCVRGGDNCEKGARVEASGMCFHISLARPIFRLFDVLEEFGGTAVAGGRSRAD